MRGCCFAAGEHRTGTGVRDVHDNVTNTSAGAGEPFIERGLRCTTWGPVS
nr:hypothetical protein [Kibdelosporangium sp. MJ126-NF4]CTQ94794.1 hypothetical protein [Kibdelosporangium sp. MJ126-NF4]